MMGKIKALINSIKTNVWNYKIDNNPSLFNEALKKAGVGVGENVLFVKPSSTSVDLTTPYLISIGDNVCVSKGLSLYTHDYSSFIQRSISGEVLGAVDSVKIGSNIQIGANVIILMGTTIENNVIIAAGALCKGLLKSGYVYGGVPAKQIMSVHEFIEKRRNDQFREAKNLALSYFEKYKRIPSVDVFYPTHLFPCFLPVEDWPDSFWSGFGQKMNKAKIRDFYKGFKPKFSSYESFLKEIGLKND